MPARANINVGDRFGKLTIIKEVEPNITPCGTVQRKFLCMCDCGKEIIVARKTVVDGAKQSCGCDWQSPSRKYTKEQRNSFLYSTWSGMKQRCYNKNTEGYHNYGGRGIKICDEWLNDYKAFYNWAILNGASKELSIDRIDVNGDYCPENCRWVDNQTQMRNMQYNRYIEYNGQKKLMKEWSEELGIPYDTIRGRLDNYGWTIGEALGFEEHVFDTRPERPETRKKVLQYSLNGNLIREWDSLIDINKELGISVSSIQNCCAGYTRTSNGFKWKYKDGVRQNSNYLETIKAVYQYSLEGDYISEFPSSRIAAQTLDIDASGIQKFCNGNKEKRAHCGGFLWSYKKETKYSEKTYLEGWTQHHRLSYNGKTQTILQWSKETDLMTTTIISRLEHGWEVGEALGYEHHARKGAKHTKKILQYDKDMNLIKEWHSLHFIRKETNRSKKTILRYLTNGELDTRGYYWRYKED